MVRIPMVVALFCLVVYPSALRCENFQTNLPSLAELAEDERALETEFQAIVDQKPKSIREGKLGEPSEIEDQAIKKWLSAVSKFHEKYDEYNERKMDFVMERYLGIATEMEADVLQSEVYTAEQKKLISQKLESLKGKYIRAQENKGNLGRPNDRERSIAINNFLNEMEKFSDVVRKPQRTLKDKWKDASRSLLINVQKLAAAGAAILNIPTMAVAYFRNGKVLDTLKPLAKTLVWAQGKNMTLKGRENLPTETPSGTLNFYALMHAHNLYDFAGLAELGSRKAAILSAFTVPKLKNWMENADDFVIVRGSTKNPLSTILPKIKSETINGLYIFPEGSLGAYGYETRPAQQSMGILFKLLKKEGINVRVIPVAMPQNAQLLVKVKDGNSSIDPRELHTIVGKPLEPDLVAKLMELGDRQTIGQMIRQSWMEAQVSDMGTERILGMPPLPQLVQAMDEKMGSSTGCNQWFAKMGTKYPTQVRVSYPQ